MLTKLKQENINKITVAVQAALWQIFRCEDCRMTNAIRTLHNELKTVPTIQLTELAHNMTDENAHVIAQNLLQYV